MELHPRYDGPPLIHLDGDPAAVAEPAIRQRRRLVEVLSGFDEAAWSHPSRCAGWTNRDVMVHLDSTNSFWAFSLRAGLDGRPTRFLEGFDPARSPAELVAASGDPSGAEVLDRLAASTDALVGVWEQLAATDWERAAEAPPGHLRISEVTHHALWDSWVHERDVLAPLGVEQVVEPDEVLAALRYGAALGPALDAVGGDLRTGAIGLRTSDLGDAGTVRRGETVTVVDGIGDDADIVLTGAAADLVDALCFRRPLDHEVPEVDRWLLGGLAEVFDLTD